MKNELFLNGISTDNFIKNLAMNAHDTSNGFHQSIESPRTLSMTSFHLAGIHPARNRSRLFLTEIYHGHVKHPFVVAALAVFPSCLILNPWVMRRHHLYSPMTAAMAAPP